MSDELTPTFTLPFWMGGPEASKLAAAARNWFSLLMGWAIWPARQMDPETCCESVLDLIAWQRDIDRFDGEPLALFRLRVKYAYVNARDAGSTAGFARILQRLGVGYVEQEERMPGRDWDIIGLRLSDSQLSENQRLLLEIIQHYGRTCRRYEWTVITPSSVQARSCAFGCDYLTVCASVPPLRLATTAHGFCCDYRTATAKL